MYVVPYLVGTVYFEILASNVFQRKLLFLLTRFWAITIFSRGKRLGIRRPRKIQQPLTLGLLEVPCPVLSFPPVTFLTT